MEMEDESAQSDRIISPQVDEGADGALDYTLRPQKLDDYVGQQAVKDNLKIFMEAAKTRGEPLEHVLIFGPPGLGKTTLAHIIAAEMGGNIRVTSGPAIERTGDLAAILTNLADGDILFIDEIHRLNKSIEEILYPAMEDYALDIVIGKGPSARTLRLNLPKFTLIGATTKISGLSSPLRDRFGNVYRLNFYETDEIGQIIARAANILSVEMDSEAKEIISGRARQTPRIANRLLKRVRDYAQVKADGKINAGTAKAALMMLDVNELGLDKIDRDYLRLLLHKFNGGPCGLNTIASALSEDMDSVEDVIEPYLLQLGFINRTGRGRVLSEAAYRHLGVEAPSDLQQKLV